MSDYSSDDSEDLGCSPPLVRSPFPPSGSLIRKAASMGSIPSIINNDDDSDDSLSMTSIQRKPRVLPLDSFYKAVLSDLLLSRNESFFNYLFSQIFSRKLKARLDGKPISYDELRLHFLSLRRRYYAHQLDGVLKWGPCLSSAFNGDREGYLAAHSICASLAASSGEDRAQGLLQYDTLFITDTMEIQWVEGKDGEVRRISRFDRTTRRPICTP